MQCTASLLGLVGSATRAMHCHTSWGCRAVELVQRACAPAGGTESRAQRVGLCRKSDPPAMDYLPVWGQWAVKLLQRIALLPGGKGQWKSFNMLSHYLGTVGSGINAMHCLTTWGQQAEELLQRTASLSWGREQWNCCNALPHCLGALGNGICPLHCLPTWGQWALELLQRTAFPPGNSGWCKSCNALPHRFGTVGCGTVAMRGPSSSGDGESCPGSGCCLKSATAAMY